MDAEDFFAGFVAPMRNNSDTSMDDGGDRVGQNTESLQATVNTLEGRLDRLALISRAMFELLQEKTGVSEQDLMRKVAEVDIRDGKADGKMTPLSRKCPSCDSMISPRFNRCLFCGYRDESSDPFNPVK